MKPRFLNAVLIITVLLAGCGTPPPAPAATDTPTAIVEAPTATSEPAILPSDTPAATDTAQPVEEPTQTLEATLPPQATLPAPGTPPMVTPIKDPVNCRYGPGTVFLPIGIGLQFGKSTRIVGKNGDGSFWQVMNPDGLGDVCWVSAVVVTATGDLSSIQVAPTPKSFVTDVTVSVDALGDNTAGCSLPVDFGYTGEITVSGPMTVTWHWVASKGSVSSTPKTSIFNSGGTYSFADTLSISSTGYANVQLIVTSPGKTVGEAEFKVVCK